MEEEEEEEENISWEKRGYDTVKWIEACDSSLEWEVLVVAALMYLVKGRHEICETSGLGRGAVEFFAILGSYAALDPRRSKTWTGYLTAE